MNNKTLLIAEKPSLCRNIVEAIGRMQSNQGYYENDNYIVSFAFGHLLELKSIDQYLRREKAVWNMAELPFIPDPFEFELKDDKGVKDQYKILKDLIGRRDVTCIVNAGDADREGEVIINNIIYRIFSELDLEKDVKRLWLTAQNTEGIQKAIKVMEPISAYENLYQEGLARTYSDWLYGINLTRYLTIKAGGGQGAISVGRVLTPVVKFVYDQDMTIKNFRPEKYYEIDAIIGKGDQKIKTSVKNARFDANQREEAESLFTAISGQTYQITKKEVKNIEKQPRKLFSLTTLQNLMARKYKMNLDETLEIVQWLYEKGYVSYPRTNTEYLTSAEKEDIKQLIVMYQSVMPYNLTFKDKKSLFDDSKVESHSALIPTKKAMQTSPDPQITDRQKLVYEHILQRFLANFIADSIIVEQTTIRIDLACERFIEIKGESFDYENANLPELELPDIKDPLPYLEEGEPVKILFELASKETSAPKKATLEELNNYLKNPFRKELKNTDKDDVDAEDNDADEYRNILKGVEIGTVATRDGIIKKAEKSGYIENKKTVLSITDRGKYVIESLEKLGVDLTKEKTVSLSCELKKVYKGEREVSALVDSVAGELQEIIKQETQIEGLKRPEKESIGKCPRCGKQMFESEKAFYCEGYKDDPKCTFSIWKNDKWFDVRGKKPTKTIVKALLDKGQAKVSGFKKKDGTGTYDAIVKMIDTGQYVNFEMEFDNKPGRRKK